jgi:hypothetical protein
LTWRLCGVVDLVFVPRDADVALRCHSNKHICAGPICHSDKKKLWAYISSLSISSSSLSPPFSSVFTLARVRGAGAESAAAAAAGAAAGCERRRSERAGTGDEERAGVIGNC